MKSVKTQLIFIISIISITAIVLASLAFLAYDTFTFRKTMSSKVATLAEVLGYNVSAAILFNDEQAASDTLAALRSEVNIISACVYNDENKVFARYLRKNSKSLFPAKPQKNTQFFKKNRFVLFHTIIQDKQKVGVIYLESDLQVLNNRFNSYLAIMGIVIVVCFFITLILTTFLQKLITTPIQKMTTLVKDIATTRDFSKRLELNRKDELGILGNQFDAMNKAMHSYHTTLIDMANLVQQITDSRDFSKRLGLERKDELGTLSTNFDTMCTSMQEHDRLQVHQRVFLQKMILTSSTTPEAMLQLGFNECINQTGAQTGILYALDDKEKFVPASLYGVAEEKKRTVSFSPGEGLVGQTAIQKTLLLFDAPQPQQHLEIDAGVCVYPPSYLLFLPVVFNEKTIAVIALGSMQPFTEEKQKICAMLSNQLTIGYDNVLKAMSVLEHTQKIEKQNKEILKQQQVLQQTNEELITASRHKSEFLANMSHELRTPLNAMIGYTSLAISALHNSIEEKQLRNLKRAEHSAQSLLHLINDVLDFSKIEAGKMELLVEESDLEEIIEDSLFTIEGLIVDKDVEAYSEISSELPEIISDSIKIKRILNNLLGNSAKFTEKGKIVVKAKPTPDGKNVYIEVEDTGCGISQKKIEHIFDPFKQADSSINKRFGGTGLGLAITKRLADMLGIKISISSEVGVGTIFSLLIPIIYSNTKEIEKTTKEKTTKEIEKTTIEKTTKEKTTKEIEKTTIEKTTKETEEEKVKKEVKEKVKTLNEAYQKKLKKSVSYDPFEIPNDIKGYVLSLSTEKTYSELRQHLTNLPLEVVQVSDISECILHAESKYIWTIVIEANGHGMEILFKCKQENSLCHIPMIVCSFEEKEAYSFKVEYIPKPFDEKTLTNTLLRLNAFQKGKVLVVDDDNDIGGLYQQILCNAGYDPHWVQNGKEAIEYLEKGNLPEVIILDLLMPTMDGFETLAALQKNESWYKIPVIIASGKDITTEEQKTLEQGSNTLLKKGQFSPEELSIKIKHAINSVELGNIRSVLIVDDNEFNLSLMGSVFEDSEYSVFLTDSGKKAIELAKKHHPDVVLTDLAMPEVNGFDVTSALKENVLTSDIIIIACSAFTTEEFREKAAKAGCEGYITKPIQPIELIEQVKKIVLCAKIKHHLSDLRRRQTTKKIKNKLNTTG